MGDGDNRKSGQGDGLVRGGIGRKTLRVEDKSLVTGRGRFLDDIQPDGSLHIAFVRSTEPHAELVSLDLDAARRAPGVVRVIGPDDLAGLPRLEAQLNRAGVTHIPRSILPGDRVRFVGEPIAAVVAETQYAAEDGAELVLAGYEPLTPAFSIDAALAGETPALHGDDGNVIFKESVEVGAVDEAFAEAATVVERTFRNPRYSAAPMEGRGAIAIPDGERLLLWSSTQIPHILAESIELLLARPADSVRVSCPDIGGGFGQKANVYPEELLVAWAALELGRPVKWTEDRNENLLAATHSREQKVKVRAAADAEGRILAIDAEVYCDVGGYAAYPWGQILEPLGTSAMIPGPYALRNYRFTSHAVATNKSPVGPYRGVGLPVAVLVHERLMEIVAGELGIDSGEIRRRNYIPAELMPYESAGGCRYDSGHYEQALDKALAAIGYEELKQKRDHSRAEGRLVGIGIASYVEWTGTNSDTYKTRGMTNVRGYDAARIAIAEDGGITLWTSCPALGQGVATTFAQIVSEHLGVPFEAIEVQRSDSAEAPSGSGSFASRSAISAGGALIGVSRTLTERIASIAADALEANPDDIVIVDGYAQVKGTPGKKLSLAEVAARAEPGSLDVGQPYDPPETAYPYATHVCQVEIDPDTGHIALDRYVVAEDCGRIINPMIVDGQVHGATAQGIGGALYESLIYGPDGQIQTGSFMDYLVPTSLDVPPLEVHHLETPSPDNRGGFKGVGEGGTLAPPAAIANAVSDALGREFNTLPITPEAVLAAIAG